MHLGADAVSDQIANDTEAVFFAVGLDGVGDVADAVADAGLGDAEGEGLLRDGQKFLNGGRDGANGNGEGVVADVAVVLDHDVEGDDVAVAQDALQGADAVDHLFVDREAGVGGEAAISELITEAGAACAPGGDQILCYLVQVVGGDAGLHVLFQLVENIGGDRAGFAHPRDAGGIFDRDHGRKTEATDAASSSRPWVR